MLKQSVMEAFITAVANILLLIWEPLSHSLAETFATHQESHAKQDTH